MRIIKLPDIMRIQASGSSESALVAQLDCANVAIKDEAMTFSGYGTWLWNRRTVDYNGKIYRVKTGEGVVPDAALIESGESRLVDEEGKSPDYPPLAQEQLILTDDEAYRSRARRGDLVSGVMFDMSTFETATVMADLSAETAVTSDSIDIGGSTLQLLDDRLVGFERNSRQLVCVDTSLETIWSYETDRQVIPDYVMGPCIAEGLVVMSFGPGSVTQVPGEPVDGVRPADKKQHHDGLLVAVDLQTGEEQWRTVIPKSIDDIALKGDSLQVASVNELHIIDLANGETSRVIQTGLSDDYDRGLYRSFLVTSDDSLLFCHPADATVLIYGPGEDCKAFKVPTPYTLKECHRRDAATSKLYFELRPHGKRETYHMFPLLEFDIETLDREIDYYEGPAVEVELRDSEDAAGQSEVWITMQDDSGLEEALVYAEMHTEDQAWYHGHQGTLQHTERMTDNFNGKVHFRYLTKEPSNEKTRSKLRLLESRFTDWAVDHAFSALDNSNAATLDAQVIQA